MLFAFSRDGAVPGAQYWAKLNHSKVPVNAVLAVGRRRPHPHPAGADRDQHRHRRGADLTVDYAFFAVVSIGVIGLYLAFAIPI